jgi:hypothetical protein
MQTSLSTLKDELKKHYQFNPNEPVLTLPEYAKRYAPNYVDALPSTPEDIERILTCVAEDRESELPEQDQRFIKHVLFPYCWVYLDMPFNEGEE